MVDIDPVIAKAGPGLIGSLVAVGLMRDVSPWRRVIAFIAGAACSYYGADTVVLMLPAVKEGFAGFVLGLFGMALVVKIYETLDDIKPAQLMRDFFTKRGWL
jgi:hypothetical protein